METRIKKNFNLLNGKCTIIPFVSGGDPDIKNSTEILKSFAKNGAKILECGFNFNAPVSDGDPIQNSSYRALQNGAYLDKVFEIIKEFRKDYKEQGIILMGYWNVIINFGEDNFLKKCKEVGIDGLIISDLPYPENIPFIKKCRNFGVTFVQLIAPTTSNERISKINEYADEMIYYISMLGVTGSALKNSPEDIKKKYLEIKKLCSGGKRAVIGFGITQDVIKKFKDVDGLVVGSQICSAIEKSIQNGQNSAAVESSTILYKSLLNEVKWIGWRVGRKKLELELNKF